MANISGTISRTKLVVANGDVLTAQIRDTNASHYLGRLNSDQAPTGSSITLATGVSVTAKNNDWINLQTKPDAYLFTGSTWIQFGGGGGGSELVKTNIVNSINTASPSSSAPKGTALNLWSIDPSNEMLILNKVAFEKSVKGTGTFNSDTWAEKTWSGYEIPYEGNNIWTDGDNIYYSSGSSEQYVLDKSTSTWSFKSWNGDLTSFRGEYIWTDGENIYYSYNSAQYVLNKSTSTWSTKSWTGLTSFDGRYIWTDGDNIYWSDQYVLNKTTSTWSFKSWNGDLTSFNGEYIWTDGDNIYYSWGSDQYVLDKSTSTWSTKTWSGLTRFDATYIWTDGNNIYYSDQSTQYVLE